jgi:hypothetical protein
MENSGEIIGKVAGPDELTHPSLISDSDCDLVTLTPDIWGNETILKDLKDLKNLKDRSPPCGQCLELPFDRFFRISNTRFEYISTTVRIPTSFRIGFWRKG